MGFWGTLAFFVLLGGSVSAEQVPKPVEILMEVVERDFQFEGTLHLQPIAGSGGPRSAEALSVPIKPGALVVPLVPGRWLAKLESPQGYSPPVIIDTTVTSKVPSPVRLLVWPQGLVRASLDNPSRRPLPTSLHVEFSRPPSHQSSHSLPAGRAGCPIEQGRLHCFVPAGPLDLVVRADGFVPHYRWDSKVKAGEAIELGTLVLVPGASVVGRVAAEGATFDPSNCLVRLIPRLGLAASSTDYVLKRRLTGTGPTTSVDGRGFFQLRGVAPGSYRLEVVHPGFATAVLPEIEILEERETSLDAPLLLRPPLELSVLIEPALDALERPWQISISRYQDSEGTFDPPLFEGKASLGGELHLREVPAGRYWISVTDATGARLWSDPEILVEGEADSQVRVAIDYLPVRGELLYGDEGVPGEIHFGGRNGLVRTAVVTDTEGRFEVLLPRSGLWDVAVELSEPPVQRTFRRTLVRGSDGWAELELKVPATRIFGRVVGEEGMPIEGARVFAAVAGIARQTSSTDQLGHFEILGAPVGEVALSAESLEPDALAGESQFVQLFENQSLGPIEIVLAKRRALVGRVVDGSGPVAGAVVSWLVLVPETVGSSAPALTDHEGRFELKLPSAARELLVTIAAAGRALSVQRVPVQSSVELLVESEGGEISLDVGNSRDPADATGREGTLAFFVDGLPVGTATLARWAREHGASAFRGRVWRLPRLAPGIWSVCLGSEPVVSGVDPEGWRGRARCAEGWVVPGGRLELTLEAEPDAGKPDSPRLKSPRP
jgi:hypothetical protein